MIVFKKALLFMLFSFGNTINAEPTQISTTSQEETVKSVSDDTQNTIIQPSGIYALFDLIGKVTDQLITRGDLDEKHQKMFNDIAKKMGIDYRGIQAKNMGLIPRVGLGYANAFAHPLTNRVYFNEDLLNELTDEEKQFLMAHELAHHRNNHGIKIGVFSIVFEALMDSLKDALIDHTGNSDFLTHYCVNRHNKILGIIPFNLYTLITSQISQKYENEADAEAITIAGVDPEHGVDLLNSLENPNTIHWPRYAKLQNFLAYYQKIILYFPILNLHISHPPTYKRQAHLRSLQKRHKEKISKTRVVTNENAAAA